MSHSGSSSPLTSPPPSPSADGYLSLEESIPTHSELQPAELRPFSHPNSSRPGPVESEHTAPDHEPSAMANVNTDSVEDGPFASKGAEDNSGEVQLQTPTDTMSAPTELPWKRRIKPRLISQPERNQSEATTDKKRDFDSETPADGPIKKRKVLKPAAKQVPKSPRKKSKLPLVTPRKLRRWQPDFVIQDPKSPIAHADIRAILSHPLAWFSLSPEDKAEILAAFPDNQHILKPGTPDAAPNIASLRSDDNFRYDTARFVEHIADGRHDPQWLHEAWMAHERNRAGDFDEFEVRTFEEDWGVKLPDTMRDGQTPRGQRRRSSRARSGDRDEDAEQKLANASGAANGQVEMSDTKTQADVPEGRLDAILEMAMNEADGEVAGEEEENEAKESSSPSTTNGLAKDVATLTTGEE